MWKAGDWIGLKDVEVKYNLKKIRRYVQKFCQYIYIYIYFVHVHVSSWSDLLKFFFFQINIRDTNSIGNKEKWTWRVKLSLIIESRLIGCPGLLSI